MGYVQFKVIATDPSPYCVVSSETVVYCAVDPIQLEV